MEWDNSAIMLGNIFRPRVRLTVAYPADEAIRVLEDRLDESDLPLAGMVSRRLLHAEIRIDRDRRHFWSPCMDISLEEKEGECVLRGRVGPHPSLWSFFAFVYITAFSAAGFGAIFGLSQWSLGIYPWALWVAPVALAVCLGMFLVSRAGQKLAAGEMEMMESFLRESMNPRTPPG